MFVNFKETESYECSIFLIEYHNFFKKINISLFSVYNFYNVNYISEEGTHSKEGQCFLFNDTGINGKEVILLNFT